jgi:hypothetical protein
LPRFKIRRRLDDVGLGPCFCGAPRALVLQLRSAGCIAPGDHLEPDARAARRWCEDRLLEALGVAIAW